MKNCIPICDILDFPVVVAMALALAGGSAGSGAGGGRCGGAVGGSGWGAVAGAAVVVAALVAVVETDLEQKQLRAGAAVEAVVVVVAAEKELMGSCNCSILSPKIKHVNQPHLESQGYS